MGIFNRKEKQSEKYAELQEKYIKIVTDVKELQLTCEGLEQKYKRLQGLLNRKLYGDDEENAEPPKKTKEKSLYSDPFDGIRGLKI